MMVRKETLDLIEEQKVLYETEKNIEIPDCIAESILNHCIRKVECVKYDESYLPLLYKHELPMQLSFMLMNMKTIAEMRKRKDEVSNVHGMQTNAMSSEMP